MKSDWLESMLRYGLDDCVYKPAEAELLSYPLRPNRTWGKLAEDMMKIHIHLVKKLSMLGVWSYNPTSQYVSLIWFSVKLRERLSLNLYLIRKDVMHSYLSILSPPFNTIKSTLTSFLKKNSIRTKNKEFLRLHFFWYDEYFTKWIVILRLSSTVIGLKMHIIGRVKWKA